MTDTVAFFISGHGFGHASRQVEIIHALAGGGHSTDIVLRTSADPALLARTLRVPYRLLEGPCDPGIVQRDAVTHDDEASLVAIRRFYEEFDARVDQETRRLTGQHVGLIVADIPPLAFAVADRLGVPSIAIANFTWDWIYEALPDIARRAPTALSVIRRAYRLATRALALPFTGGFEVFGRRETLPLVARHGSPDAAATRRRLALAGVDPARPLALLSFGGYGLRSLSPGTLVDLDEWTIVTTDQSSRLSPAPAHVVTLPESVFLGGTMRYEDVVAAADVVITKPGYGIIAECAANDTALVYTSRGAFREYDLLVDEMPRYVRCAYLSNDDLRAGRWRRAVEAALHAPRPPTRRTDGADVAAGIIQSMLAGAAR